MVFMLRYMLHVKDIFSFVSEHSETNLFLATQGLN